MHILLDSPRPDRFWVSTQPSIQWVSGALTLGVKRLRREADRSPPSSAKVKECVHSRNTPSWRGVHLKNTETTLPFYSFRASLFLFVLYS